MIELALKKLGYDKETFNEFIDLASDGQEAIGYVNQSFLSIDQEYTLVITDCSMPIMNGY